jgi:glucose/arabinose dehydrogenase
MLTSTEPFMLTTTSAFAPFSQNQEVIQGTVKANGTILRMDPDGSGLEVYAWGLRNPYGVAWGPDGRLHVAENGFDARGSRPSPTHLIPSG